MPGQKPLKGAHVSKQIISFGDCQTKAGKVKKWKNVEIVVKVKKSGIVILTNSVRYVEKQIF